MKIRSMLYSHWLRRPKALSPTKTIAVAFAVIILAGALLLDLPAASRSGVSCGFRPALFTATSATCVTGLVLYDTWTQWSGFGQAVILGLIEIGGLGFMSAAALVVFVLRKRIGLKQRMVMAQALSLNDMEGVVRIQKTLLIGSLSIEAIGALILTVRFWPEYGFVTALKWGVFHSVSAFCNAGFDILGSIAPGGSMIPFQNDPTVLLTLCALIVVGGLGFLVWQEIWEKRRFRKLSVYARLVLVATLVLILTGWVATCLLEWNNPDTLGAMNWWQKLLNGLFQSVTLRTAGFAAVDQGKLTGAGKGFSMVLMLIGGSSGSTAGGLKTVTVGVLLLALRDGLRGRDQVVFRGRRIPGRKVLDAMTLALTVLLLFLSASMLLSLMERVPYVQAAFETASAMGTVGVTMGITPGLSVPSALLVIALMFLGRVGILSFSIAFLTRGRGENKILYPSTEVMIG